MESSDRTVTPPPVRRHVVVFAGGDVPRSVEIIEADLVIAADGGADNAFALGFTPNVIVGDLDSITSASLEKATRLGCEIVAHRPDKDQSDLELALIAATGERATHITVVGGGGGRISHLLTNVAVLAANHLAGIGIRWLVAGAEIYVVNDKATVAGSPGDLITVLAIHGPATEVTLDGVRWPLAAATIAARSSLGLSNELTRSSATVQVGTGTLLVIHERRHSP